MDDHFRCNKCQTVFTPDTARKRQERNTVEAWGQRQHVIDEYDQCPTCGSETFEDFLPCQSCHKNEAAAGIDECEPCWAKHQEAA